MSQPPEKAVPRPAASVVMIRDGAQGIEAFMIERHQGAGLAFSGALVFPGGKVDAEDHATGWADLQRPSAEGPDLAFWIAAVRETFEESGILLARTRSSSALIGGEDAARIVADARAVSAASGSGDPAPLARADFAALLQREQLAPAIESLIHFGHWITPLWAPRRFDTHFFLVPAPKTQRVLLDADESAAGMWMRPADVLVEADAGKRSLVAVTRFTLELLDTWGSVEEATTAARSRRVVTVLPERVQTASGLVLRIPKEAGYVRSEMAIVPGG